MNRKIINGFLVFTALLITLWGCAASHVSVNQAQLRSVQTVAVIPFEAKPGVDANVANEAESAFSRALLDLGYILVERSKLDKILEEQRLSLTGLTESDAIKVGNLAGAQAILIGTVLKNYQETKMIKEYDSEPAKEMNLLHFVMNCRMVNVSSGSVLFVQETMQPYGMAEPEDAYGTIDAYRTAVLQQMIKDLKKKFETK